MFWRLSITICSRSNVRHGNERASGQDKSLLISGGMWTLFFFLSKGNNAGTDTDWDLSIYLRYGVIRFP